MCKDYCLYTSLDNFKEWSFILFLCNESKLLDKKEIEIHKDMTVDELILASEGIHKLPIVDDVQEKEDVWFYMFFIKMM